MGKSPIIFCFINYPVIKPGAIQLICSGLTCGLPCGLLIPDAADTKAKRLIVVAHGHVAVEVTQGAAPGIG